jgi:hypothetical protein
VIGTAIILSALAAHWQLTPNGLGPVRIGMTQKRVAEVLKSKLTGEAIEDENVCVEKEAKALPGVTFMFEAGKLTRISIGKPSPITTARGIGVGVSAAEIRRAYGKLLKAEKNYYEDPPAEYLTWWTVPKKRGLRFETSSDRKAYVIHAGTDAIRYVEGCA